MKYYLIFALFFSSFIFSQDIDIEKLKKLDTIYVLFKEGKDQKKQFIKEHNEKGYWFSKRIFLEIKSDSNNKRIEKKRFLRKHKEEILTIDFLKLKNRRKLEEINKTPKVYYIIDEAEFTKKTITLTEVKEPRIYL